MQKLEKVAFFPYWFNEMNELSLLFYSNFKENDKEVLNDFGWEINQFEPTVYYSAVRSFWTLTKGAFSARSSTFDPASINFEEEINFNLYQPGLKDLQTKKKYPLIHSVIENTLALFYPLPFFMDRETLNSDIQKFEGMENFDFNWITIDNLDDVSIISLVSELNKKFINENKTTLKNIQEKRQKYIEQIEAYKNDIEKNVAEGAPEPIESQSQLPDYAILWTDTFDTWR